MFLFKAEKKKKPNVILAVLVNLSIPYNFLDPKDNTLFLKRKTRPHPSPVQSLSCPSPSEASLTALAKAAGQPAIQGRHGFPSC